MMRLQCCGVNGFLQTGPDRDFAHRGQKSMGSVARIGVCHEKLAGFGEFLDVPLPYNGRDNRGCCLSPYTVRDNDSCHKPEAKKHLTEHNIFRATACSGSIDRSPVLAESMPDSRSGDPGSKAPQAESPGRSTRN